MRIQIAERKYERPSTQVVNRQHPSPEGDERDTFKQSADFQQKVSVCLKFYMKAAPQDHRQAKQESGLPRELCFAPTLLYRNVGMDQRAPEGPVTHLVYRKTGQLQHLPGLDKSHGCPLLRTGMMPVLPGAVQRKERSSPAGRLPPVRLQRLSADGRSGASNAIRRLALLHDMLRAPHRARRIEGQDLANDQPVEQHPRESPWDLGKDNSALKGTAVYWRLCFERLW